MGCFRSSIPWCSCCWWGWSSSGRTNSKLYAVSLVASAAFVLETKELILCWSGAALRVGRKVYSVGDRIQIAGHRGIVLDHDIFAIKLLEIGQGPASHLYTGCVAVFLNSLLFTDA